MIVSKLKTAEHYIGHKFHHWLILAPRPNGLKGMVLARCDCGKEVITRLRSLKSGVSKSCGCKKSTYSMKGKGKRIADSNTALTKCYSHYRTKANRAVLDFDLTIEEFKTLTSMNCYYCNDKPSGLYKTKYDTYSYNGLDRVDNSKGYTKSNAAPCCYYCNTKKGAVSINMIYMILEFINGKT